MKLRKIILIALCAFAFLPIQQARTIDTTQYWMKIKATDKFQRSVIADTGVAIEAVREDYVIAYGNIQELQRVEKLGWLETSFALTEAMAFPPADREYHDYTALTQELQDLAKQYPQILKMSSIGKSTEGRDIWAMRLSGDLSQADKLPAIIYMAGHHAREHLSVETPFRIFKNIVTEYANGNPRIQRLVNSRDIHFIPAVNPDGLEFDVASGRYQMWRKNRAHNGDGTYGVDLNRNYGYQWGTGGSSKDTSSDIYMGTQPFSEPETRAIRDYVESHQNITILLSFHTFSQLILYPWGHKYAGIENANDKAVHEAMARKMAEWNHYKPQQSSGLYIASGDTTDWSYGAHKIISFTFELDPANTGGAGGFYPGAKVIPQVVEKNTEPFLYLMEYADNPYRVINGDGGGGGMHP